MVWLGFPSTFTWSILRFKYFSFLLKTFSSEKVFRTDDFFDSSTFTWFRSRTLLYLKWNFAILCGCYSCDNRKNESLDFDVAFYRCLWIIVVFVRYYFENSNVVCCLLLCKFSSEYRGEGCILLVVFSNFVYFCLLNPKILQNINGQNYKKKCIFWQWDSQKRRHLKQQLHFY